jgi:hypothetical protein
LVFCRWLGKIIRKVRDHVPHTTARVWDIAWVTRDQVYVQVRDRLPCVCADVDADVVAAWLIPLFDMGFTQFDRCREGLLLFGGSFKPSRHVPFGDQEQMSGAYGKCVPKGKDVGIAKRMSEENLLRVDLAKRAKHGAYR